MMSEAKIREVTENDTMVLYASTRQSLDSLHCLKHQYAEACKVGEDCVPCEFNDCVELTPEAYIDTWIEAFSNLYNHAQELEERLKNSIELPCNIGTEVYVVTTVKEGFWQTGYEYVREVRTLDFEPYMLNDWGKTVFGTYDEAANIIKSLELRDKEMDKRRHERNQEETRRLTQERRQEASRILAQKDKPTV